MGCTRLLGSWASAGLIVLAAACSDPPKRVEGMDPTCEAGMLVPCRCDTQTVGRAQCMMNGESISACMCGQNTGGAAFTNCDAGDQVACPCPSTQGFAQCDVTGVYMECTCTNVPIGTGGAMQGSGGAMQGTGGATQGTGGAMQGTGGAMQGTGGAMQGTGGGFMQGAGGAMGSGGGF